MLREFQEYSGAVRGGCPQEPQFREMYEVLGNAEALEDIRLSHPTVEHCDKLMVNARACNGCALNPMKPEKLEKKEKIEAGSLWINTALELNEAARMNLLSLQTIDSTEQLLLQSMRRHEDYQLDERLAVLIASKIGEVLIKIFGKK